MLFHQLSSQRFNHNFFIMSPTFYSQKFHKKYTPSPKERSKHLYNVQLHIWHALHVHVQFFIFLFFFFIFFSNNAIFRTWKLISSHRFSRMSSTRFYATEITSWRGKELFLVDRNSVARGSLIRWRYNPKDEHLERSRRGTEGDGFPCIGN